MQGRARLQLHTRRGRRRYRVSPTKTKPKATSRHNLTLSRVRGGLGEGVLIETKGDVAYELGHKRVHSQGLFAVTPHHLTSVTVSGKVRVKENGE